MQYLVNVDYEYQRAKSKFLRLSLIFSSILTVAIVGDVLLVTLANEDFLLNLIFAIIITVLFSWFAIYFFTVIYGDVNARYRYFKGYEKGLKSTAEVIYLRKDEQAKAVNGLIVYPLYLRFIDGIDETEKIVYTLDKDISFSEGDKLSIETYQRILIKADKHQ